MAKEQKRGNREQKKPKSKKKEETATLNPIAAGLARSLAAPPQSLKKKKG